MIIDNWLLIETKAVELSRIGAQRSKMLTLSLEQQSSRIISTPLIILDPLQLAIIWLIVSYHLIILILVVKIAIKGRLVLVIIWIIGRIFTA